MHRISSPVNGSKACLVHQVSRSVCRGHFSRDMTCQLCCVLHSHQALSRFVDFVRMQDCDMPAYLTLPGTREESSDDEFDVMGYLNLKRAESLVDKSSKK
jgi:hypothetical protein